MNPVPNFFARQELKKWQKGPRENLPSFPTPPPGCPAYNPRSSSSSPSPPPHHHPPTSSSPNPPPSPPPSGCLEGLQTLPSLLKGPVGQAFGCLHTCMGSKIMTGLK